MKNSKVIPDSVSLKRDVAILLVSKQTFSCLLLLVEDDEQVAGAFRTEGQHDALHYGGQDGQSQQQRPQSV